MTSCGLAGVDDLGDGFWPGALWTLVAPAGLGATTLSVHCAVAAAAQSEVLVVNGHLASHLARDLILKHAGATGAGPEVLGRISVASWVGMPTLGSDWHDSACERAGLVILDCLDEMWRPDEWSSSTEQRLARLRWLRELAQRHETAVLLTARLAPARTRDEFAEAERSHWTYSIFPDVSDVSLKLAYRDHNRWIVAHARGGGDHETQVLLRPGKGGLVECR